MKKFVTLLLAVPLALLLLTLAVVNRHGVKLILDPFRPDAPAWSIEAPLFVYLIGSMMFGVALGGVATWLNQGRWRRSARIKTDEARRLKSEHDRLVRERDDMVQAQKSGDPRAGGRRDLAIASH